MSQTRQEVAERVADLCKVLERTGPVGVAELRPIMRQVERSTLWKYCQRGVSLGLLTVNKSKGRSIFTVVKGWRAIHRKGIKPTSTTPRIKAVPRISAVIPVTEQMIEICTALEGLGQATCHEISEAIGDMTPEQVSRSFGYGIKEGLLVPVGQDWKRMVCKVSPTWKRIVADREIGYKLPDPPPTQWSRVNSVFHAAEVWGLSV